MRVAVGAGAERLARLLAGCVFKRHGASLLRVPRFHAKYDLRMILRNANVHLSTPRHEALPGNV